MRRQAIVRPSHATPGGQPGADLLFAPFVFFVSFANFVLKSGFSFPVPQPTPSAFVRVGPGSSGLVRLGPASKRKK